MLYEALDVSPISGVFSAVHGQIFCDCGVIWVIGDAHALKLAGILLLF